MSATAQSTYDLESRVAVVSKRTSARQPKAARVRYTRTLAERWSRGCWACVWCGATRHCRTRVHSGVLCGGCRRGNGDAALFYAPAERLDDFSPDPIYGEIAVGVDHVNAKIRIGDVDCVGAKANSIRLGPPSVSPIENMGSYARCRFQIPLRLTNSHRPETNVYPVRIVYWIDDKTNEHTFALNVFPSAEESASSSH